MYSENYQYRTIKYVKNNFTGNFKIYQSSWYINSITNNDYWIIFQFFILISNTGQNWTLSIFIFFLTSQKYVWNKETWLVDIYL